MASDSAACPISVAWSRVIRWLVMASVIAAWT
ncbi:hypothetical protein Ae331Ps2_6377c [Pseudonocardia sp. Ae331_Ps2]|nr:hypothetical protein Ae331Ps2_6377c [Pseudonocardia sp. Ae331_Ps2]